MMTSNKYKDALTYLRSSALVTDHKQKERVNECTDVLKELVDKETPKKPDYEGDGCDRNGEIIYDTWICPNCEKKYEVDYDIYDRCPNCGQAIDWSEEDE